MDVPQTNIAVYFNEVVDFIDIALETGGKVLVNCEMGMSRSSTCVLAYLMLRHQMSAGEALAKVSVFFYFEFCVKLLLYLGAKTSLCSSQCWVFETTRRARFKITKRTRNSEGSGLTFQICSLVDLGC